MKFKEVKKIFPDATDDQIQDMLDAVHSETDDLRNKLDKAQKDPDDWKKKYDDLKAEHDQYKADQEKKQTNDAKRAALKDLIKDSFSEKGLEKVLKYADLDGIELTDKGGIKDAAKTLSGMKEEWSDYVTKVEDHGNETDGKDGAGGNNGGSSKLSRADIMKISDPSERQAAIMANPDAFR